jgi:hypothetical protein
MASFSIRMAVVLAAFALLFGIMNYRIVQSTAIWEETTVSVSHRKQHLVPRVDVDVDVGLTQGNLWGHHHLEMKDTNKAKQKQAALQSSTPCEDIDTFLLPQLNRTTYRPWEEESIIIRKDQKKRRHLGFVHIPKTGGSSIVAAAAAQNMSWADELFAKWPKPQWKRQLWWHTPIQYLPILSNSTKNKNPYVDQDLFLVVRNPYSRALSEFFYSCKSAATDRKPPECKAAHGPNKSQVVNQAMQERLHVVLSSEPNTKMYYQRWGHWIPQFDFVYDTHTHTDIDITLANYGTTRTSRRLVDHYILHQERLAEEFSSLMKAYSLSFIQLPTERHKARQGFGAKFGIHNLTLETLRLIETVYAKDFQIGDYLPLSPLLASCRREE